MHDYEIRLFGKCSVIHNGEVVSGLHQGKAQNLLCYLLVNRVRVHSRETLASLHWGDSPTAQSKKYLRTTLWQLRAALHEPEEGQLLLIGPDSAQVNPAAKVGLDVAQFEQAYLSSQTLTGNTLGHEHVELLGKAVDLYRGDLLEGCYEDWCLFERERLQNVYLIILDKLLSVCEERGNYEQGWDYASRTLRYDPACERTHQRLMRLYHRAGNRASALRQYEQCVAALKKELGVEPSRQTLELYARICADHPQETVNAGDPLRAPEPRHASQNDLFSRLRKIRQVLFSLRTELEEDILTLDQALDLGSGKKRSKRVRRLSA